MTFRRTLLLFAAFSASLAHVGRAATDGCGPAWLADAVFYQIYPSSYMDTNGDGIGDLPGITARLDYIKSLGVNALWLNPCFESGWFDGGYDVIDFYKIDPRFGTNTDMVQLINQAHRRGIKVCLDLVAGHTSNRCAWFKESASGDRNSRYADYYIWTDSISPNEQQMIELRRHDPDPEASVRGHFVEADAPRGRYYEKNYFVCQPALNYGYAHPNPKLAWQQPVTASGPQAVRRELRNIMAFWFDKGVDGFRVDMAASLIKNDPDRSGITALWHEMRTWLEQHYPDRVLLSEWGSPAVAIPAGFHIDFLLPFGGSGYGSLFIDRDTPRSKLPWEEMNGDTTYQHCYFDLAGRGGVKDFVQKYSPLYQATRDKGYITIPSANHDFQRPNATTRNTPAQLKVAMTFFLTMPGVPLIYYGDEIGMKYLPDLPSKEGSEGRAGSRTPMQWADGPTAGFSTCRPEQLYLPVDTEGGRISVEAEEADANSLLNYTRRLIALRHAHAALGNAAAWAMVSSPEQPYPMVYRRSDGRSTCIVALNPSGRKVKVQLPVISKQATTELLRCGTASVRKGALSLGPVSAVVLELK